MARILVVDDNAHFRSAVHLLLEDAGFEVVEAADGAAAVRIYQQQPADAVLCDLFMPVRDGLEVIRELCAAFPDVKVVAMSGGASTGGADMLPIAKHFGAKEILHKPFEQAAVLAAIRRVLESSVSA